MYKEGGIQKAEGTTNTVSLMRVYPNPIKSSATISYYASEKSNVTIRIYNSVGLLQEIIQNKIVDKGYHTVTWSPTNPQNGTFFCTVKQGKKLGTKKLIVSQ